MSEFKDEILKQIDSMSSYREKLEFLNNIFMSTNDENKEEVVLSMITDLKFFGR